MFVEVKEISMGGTGVPVPVYRCTYRGEVFINFARGQAQEALDWLRGRSAAFAVYADIDGVVVEIARGIG